MTQQYLAGELSLILGELQAVAASDAGVRDVARLRREAEAGSRAALASVARRALELVDGWCWDAVARGDATAFAREEAIRGELWEFALCAGLIEGR
jgi:hypothetical protein